MGVKHRKQVGSFIAKDGQGKSHTIIVYQDFIDASDLSDPHATIPGMKGLRTASGQAVNRHDKGKYEIVGRPGIPLTSDDPNAE